MRTFVASAKRSDSRWHVIDAKGQVLGRVATLASRLLQGKHKPTYTPFIDTGDHVVVVNAATVKLTGQKESQKLYRRHSGFEGGLREGELVTNTEGMLPEAELVFLDELLNANSAILNSLLTVLNERVFRRGRESRALPMIMAVGASNHLPEDEALRALFDRFLLRVHCGSVPDDRLGDVLSAGWQLERRSAPPATPVSMEEVRALNGALPTVDLDAVRQPMVDLVRRRCTEMESGGRMIDAILTNTVLPQISREFLTRMREERPVERVELGVEGDEFTYSFA